MPRTLALLAVLLLAVAAAPREAVQVPLRVHVLRSSIVELHAAGSLEADAVRARVAEINRMFAPAGVAFRVERVVEESPADTAGFRRAIAGEGKVRDALDPLVDPERLLAPRGFDLYVARELSDLGIGGAYLCGAGGGRGVAFVASQDARGRPLKTRKWAHELGHALGLPHLPCEPANADRLMTSGRCEHALKDREVLSADELLRARLRAPLGPAPCGSIPASTED